MTRKRPPSTYKVGYGRPPAAGRFKKGSSGNPAGRPPKSRPPLAKSAGEVDRMIMGVANTLIEATIGGRKTKITTQQGLMKVLADRGLRGDRGAAIAFLNENNRAQARIDAQRLADIEAHQDFARRWREEKLWRAQQVPPRPEPAPHPDELVIDHDRNRILINGPQSDEEAKEWRVLRARLPGLASWIKDLEGNPKLRGVNCARETLKACRAEWALIVALCPHPSTRRAAGFDLRASRLRGLRSFEASDLPQKFKNKIAAPWFIQGLIAALRA